MEGRALACLVALNKASLWPSWGREAQRDLCAAFSCAFDGGIFFSFLCLGLCLPLCVCNSSLSLLSFLSEPLPHSLTFGAFAPPPLGVCLLPYFTLMGAVPRLCLCPADLSLSLWDPDILSLGERVSVQSGGQFQCPKHSSLCGSQLPPQGSMRLCVGGVCACVQTRVHTWEEFHIHPGPAVTAERERPRPLFLLFLPILRRKLRQESHHFLQE